jgi:hypothetical protein
MAPDDDLLWTAWSEWIRDRLNDLTAEDQEAVDHLWDLTERLWRARTERRAAGDGRARRGA